MKYNMLDKVLLKSGECAYIVEMFPDEYMIELTPITTEWPFRFIHPDDIDRVVAYDYVAK